MQTHARTMTALTLRQTIEGLRLSLAISPQMTMITAPDTS